MRNEAANVPQFYRELRSVLQRMGRPYEIIVIDDGSQDETFGRLAALQATDPSLVVIRFRRNFGQTAAFAAGFAHARGRLIVTTDGDLQNDPADIPAMIDLAEQRDADIVAGWRKDRKDAFFSRRVPSMIANWVISRTTGVHLHDYGCSLKVFRAEIVKPMKLYGEMHRFLPAIASEFGVTIEEYVVNHRPRLHGNSKYGISRTVRVVLDLLTVKFLISYRTRPRTNLRAVGPDHDGHRRRRLAVARLREVPPAHRHRRPAAAARRDGAARDGRAVHRAGPARRDAGPHLPRVAGQADLRHQGNPAVVADDASMVKRIK